MSTNYPQLTRVKIILVKFTEMLKRKEETSSSGRVEFHLTLCVKRVLISKLKECYSLHPSIFIISNIFIPNVRIFARLIPQIFFIHFP